LKKNKADHIKKIELLDSKLKSARAEIKELQEKQDEDAKIIEELQNKM
jgi:hypothetical protein